MEILHQPQTDSERKKIVLFFGIVQFLLMGKNALWPYCVIYFRELGFGSQEIGWINSIGTFTAMGLLPVMGVVSDRFLSPRALFLIAGMVLIPAYLGITILGLTVGAVFILFVVVCLFITACQQITNAMIDSWAGEEMERMGLSFGSVRRYASGGYVVISILGSILVGPFLPNWTGGVIMSLMSLGMVLVARQPMGKSMASDRDRAVRVRPNTRELMRDVFLNYRFVTYLLIVVAFSSFQGIINLDMTYLMDHAGTAQSNVGLVGAVRASTEVLLMIFLASRKKLPPYWLLLGLSGLFVAAEHLLYPFVDSLGDMLAVTLLSGIAGGFYYGFGANYVFQIVDRRAAGTAMSILGVLRALVSVIFNSLGGTVIAQSGVIALTNQVGMLALILSALFFASCIISKAGGKQWN